MKDYVKMYEQKKEKCLEEMRKQTTNESDAIRLSKILFQKTASDEEIAGMYLKVCENPKDAFELFNQDSKKKNFAFYEKEKSIRKILNFVSHVTHVMGIAKWNHLTANDLVSEAECVEEYGEWTHTYLIGYNSYILREAAEILYKASKGNCSNGPKQLWARVGMSFDLTDEEYQRFMELKDDPGIDDYVTSLIQEGKARLDGETYFPEGCNDNPEQDVEMELSGSLFDDSKAKKLTEEPDPLMEFIAKEVPWRLKEIHGMKLSKDQIEELVDSVQNNTHVMFDYDQFDEYLLDKVNQILHSSELTADIKPVKELAKEMETRYAEIIKEYVFGEYELKSIHKFLPDDIPANEKNMYASSLLRKALQAAYISLVNPKGKEHFDDATDPQTTMHVLLEEYTNEIGIVETSVLGISSDKNAVRKMMRNRIREDENDVIARNGVEEDDEDYFSTNTVDGEYVKYSITEMPVLNSKPVDKLEMDLGFATLVAEKGTAPNYSEIFVGLEDKKGVWSQDLAVIGEKYHYENDEIVREGSISLKVYSDKDSGDYTHDFDIEVYQEYPILSGCVDADRIIAAFDDELLSAFEKTLQDWEDDKIVIDEDLSEYQHLEDELFFSDIIRWNVGEITTEELIASYQEVQEDIKGLVSDDPENGKCEKEMDLKEFLSYFDFDYDIVSPGSAYEQKIRQERLEDEDLSPEDMDKDLIYLIDKQGVYLGEIYKERYPIAAESIEKIVERMDVYIQDSVIDEFEEALKNRNIDTSDLSLEKMIKKCKELGEDEVCYRLAEVIVHPELIYIAELATNNVDETSVEDVAKLLSEKHPEYANQIYQMMNAYQNPLERACDKEAIMRLKDYKKVDPTVDGFENMVNALSYDLYNSEEFLNTSSDEVDDLTWQTLQQFSVWIDDDDSENDFYESLIVKKNPLIDLKDTHEIVATIVCRILAGEVEQYPVEEALEITDADVEKVEERFYALDEEFVSLKDLLKIAKKELI